MENIVYFRDYKNEPKVASTENDISSAILDRAMQTGLLATYDTIMKTIPKVINPISQSGYEKALSICEEYAKKGGGTVRGEVRYDKWDAIIDLTVPFLEFSNRSEMDDLKVMANLADSITFESAENGWIRVHLFFLYFDDLIDHDGKDAILGRIIDSDPELVRLLEEQAKQMETIPDENENT